MIIEEKHLQDTKNLLSFIQKSPTAFHAVENIGMQLKDAGFEHLFEGDNWNLTPGKGYFVTRNQSAIIAFRVPCETAQNILITASHSDSPMFKLKNESISTAFSQYIRLNTELYGGTILSTWLDRPLSLAGRVILSDNNGGFVSKNVNIDRDLMVIPNVAIHFNRTVNSGFSYNPAVDMLPLLAQKDEQELTVKELVAAELNCSADEIAGMDLYVYNRTPGTVYGANCEFFGAPRIDNLMCPHAPLQAFLTAKNEKTIPVYMVADNEETGSATKQGAGSVFLSDTLDRICEALYLDKRRVLASSMMVSADNGHARHPNHPEMSDGQNAPNLNGGVVVKSNAAQKYTTDGFSSAIFTEICRRASVPVQHFSNRSDMAGGSTLGSISNTLVPLVTVDIGMAQLAMHSAYESAGTADTTYLIRAAEQFYNSSFSSDKDGVYRLNKG